MPKLYAEKINVPQDEIYASDYLKLLPKEQVELVRDSGHFTFLMACKDSYKRDIPELNELCGTSTEKIKLQREISSKTLAFFRKVLSY